nr:B331 [uncultured bacterium]
MGAGCASGGADCAAAGARGSPLRMDAVKIVETEATESPRSNDFTFQPYCFALPAARAVG